MQRIPFQWWCWAPSVTSDRTFLQRPASHLLAASVDRYCVRGNTITRYRVRGDVHIRGSPSHAFLTEYDPLPPLRCVHITHSAHRTRLSLVRLLSNERRPILLSHGMLSAQTAAGIVTPLGRAALPPQSVPERNTTVCPPPGPAGWRTPYTLHRRGDTAAEPIRSRGKCTAAAGRRASCSSSFALGNAQLLTATQKPSVRRPTGR